MKKRNFKLSALLVLALVLILSLFAGCAGATAATTPTAVTTETAAPIAKGGILRIRVNPEISVNYDAAGKVVDVKADNDDAKKIIADYTAFAGKESRQVVKELVEKSVRPVTS